MTAFGNAFKAARKKAGGGGGTFKFGGKSYSTKIREEVSKPAYDIKKPTGGGPAMRSRPAPKGETGAPIVITGTRHPVQAAVHTANVTNTAPGAVTKAQGPSVSDINNARTRASAAATRARDKKAGWTR